MALSETMAEALRVAEDHGWTEDDVASLLRAVRLSGLPVGRVTAIFEAAAAESGLDLRSAQDE